MIDRDKPVYKIAEEYGKMQIENLRKKNSEFKTTLPSEIKCCRYLIGNEEINNLIYRWFKDAVSRWIIISSPLLQETAIDFAQSLNNLEFKASREWHFNVCK